MMPDSCRIKTMFSLLLAVLILCIACAEPEEPGAAFLTDAEIAELLTPVHVVDIHNTAEAEALFASGVARFDSEKSFRQVSWMMDAEDISELQYRVPTTDGNWSAWKDVEITWQEGVMSSGLIRLDDSVTSLQMRGGEKILATQFNFHSLVVAPDEYGNAPAFLAERFDPAMSVGEMAEMSDEEIRIMQTAVAPSSLVISRSGWNAVNPGKICGSPHSPNRMTIHHTGIPASDGGDPAARMRQMQNFHINTRGWCDIGYHFVVSQSGRVYQGRSLSSRTGAHVGGANSNNIGISLIGNYDVDTPPQVQMEAAASIMEWVHNEHGVPLQRSVIQGHGEWPGQGTSCPGTNLRNRIGELIDRASNDPGGSSSEPAPPPPAGGCIPSADDDAGASLFDDFNPAATGYDEAVRLYDAGITQGCNASPLMFCPNCPLTRSQMAVFLVRAAGLDISNPPSTSSFSDISTTSNAFPYIEAAADAGITQGCGSGEFCPSDEITRAQAATMIHRAQGWPDEISADAPSFDDVSAGNTHYAGIETMKQRCVTDGCTANNFCPDNELTRAQAAAFISRAFNLQDSNPCAEPGGCSPRTAFGTENSAFSDFPTTQQGYDEAELLYNAGITLGCGQTDEGDAFCPNCETHRRAMVIFLVRGLGLDTSNPPAQPTFDDVPTTMTGYAHIEAAVDAGIINGCDANNFCPDHSVSRAQTATMLMRALDWQIPSSTTPSFDDVDASHSHFEGIEALNERCVTSGCRDGSDFCPNGTVSRAHMAIFIARALNLGDINPCATGGGSGGITPSTTPDSELGDEQDPVGGSSCEDVDPDFVPASCSDDPDHWDGDAYPDAEEDPEPAADDEANDDDIDNGDDDDQTTPGTGNDDGESPQSSDVQVQSGGCSTAPGSPTESALIASLLLALSLVGFRRRRLN